MSRTPAFRALLQTLVDSAVMLSQHPYMNRVVRQNLYNVGRNTRLRVQGKEDAACSN